MAYTIKGKKIYGEIKELTEKELQEVKNYLAFGYSFIEESKRGITKAEMLEELEKDPEVKKDFETAYSIKAKEVKDYIDTIEGFKKKYGINIKIKKGENKGKYVVGYHLACQIYTKWKKEQPKEDNK